MFVLFLLRLLQFHICVPGMLVTLPYHLCASFLHPHEFLSGAHVYLFVLFGDSSGLTIAISDWVRSYPLEPCGLGGYTVKD